MKIYLLRPQLQSGDPVFRQIWPDGKVDWEFWSFNCTPKASMWPRAGFPVRYMYEQQPLGEFPYVSSGAFAISLEARRQFGDTIRDAEELPLHAQDGRTFILVNLLNCCDAADPDRSEWWPLGEFRERYRVKRYVFVPERLPRASLFKTPLYKRHILATEGHLPASEEFVARYRETGARGIDFIEVWNDEERAVEELTSSGF